MWADYVLGKIELRKLYRLIRLLPPLSAGDAKLREHVAMLVTPAENGRRRTFSKISVALSRK
jgi:hypothetical protein